jgi:hypothetical protein
MAKTPNLAPLYLSLQMVRPICRSWSDYLWLGMVAPLLGTIIGLERGKGGDNHHTSHLTTSSLDMANQRTAFGHNFVSGYVHR